VANNVGNYYTPNQSPWMSKDSQSNHNSQNNYVSAPNKPYDNFQQNTNSYTSSPKQFNQKSGFVFNNNQNLVNQTHISNAPNSVSNNYLSNQSIPPAKNYIPLQNINKNNSNNLSTNNFQQYSNIYNTNQYHKQQNFQLQTPIEKSLYSSQQPSLNSTMQVNMADLNAQSKENEIKNIIIKNKKELKDHIKDDLIRNDKTDFATNFATDFAIALKLSKYDIFKNINKTDAISALFQQLQSLVNEVKVDVRKDYCNKKVGDFRIDAKNIIKYWLPILDKEKKYFNSEEELKYKYSLKNDTSITKLIVEQISNNPYFSDCSEFKEYLYEPLKALEMEAIGELKVVER